MVQLVHNLDRAESLAKRFQPVIYQEWKSIKDFPTSLMFDTDKQMEQNLFWAISDPTLYYKASEDDDYFYVFYLIFHPFDWSNSKFGIIRKLDSHTYDTEAICIRWSKMNGTMDIATVYHNSIKVQLAQEWDLPEENPVVWIEAEGHGIKPFKGKYTDGKRYVVYAEGTYKLANILVQSGTQMSRMKEILNAEGVDMPDQQAEHGEMFTAPDKLFARRD